MRVLIIKTSSMGDIIHTLPALTDAGKYYPYIQFDWVVEENFKEIPHWHPLVDRVIPVAIRRWRKSIFKKNTWREIHIFCQTVRQEKYDVIIDAQGLLKSAWIGTIAKGLSSGLNFASARESFSSLFYRKKIAIEKKQHAIHRVRQLFQKVLNYPLLTDIPDYGLNRQQFIKEKMLKPYCVFLHGTTWTTKHWPEKYWKELAKKLTTAGYEIKLPWGTEKEKERAHYIAANSPQIDILPKLTLQEMASVLAGASFIVAVDTGLGHLAAALNVPTISLYGPTNPLLTGTLGASQQHLVAQFACAPCLSRTCLYQSSAEFTVKPPCFAAVSPHKVEEQIKGFKKEILL